MANLDSGATFTLRPVTSADLDQTVTLLNACSQDIFGHDEFAAETLLTEWNDPAMNLATDTQLACAPDGTPLGYIEFWNWTPHESSWIWARVHPEYRDHGIGTALMQWAEARARTAIELAPADARVFMLAACNSDHQPSIELLQNLGFAQVRRWLSMAIEFAGPPPAPVLPDGITIRSMQPGEERAVYLTEVDSFKDHWGFTAMPEEEGFAQFQHRMVERPGHDPALWFVAMDGDQIAGIALCRLAADHDPEMGWINILGVRRPWRKRGLGLALLRHSFAELYARGQHKVGLGVDASSLTGATRLYEKAGMHAVRGSITFEKELRAGRHLSTRVIEEED